MLDNLHEEINLHSEKRYIEEKDDIFKHNNDEELGNISWANNLKRNTSFIDSIFMFQFKSNLKCRKCNTIKVNFETNYIFDLPLSLCKIVTVKVNLFRLPFRYKLYFNKINEKFAEYINQEENKKLSIITNLWNYYTNVLSFEEKKKHCINLQFSFDLEREKKMLDITKLLRGIKPLELEPENIIETMNDEKITEYKVDQLTDLITYSQEKNRIIYPDSSIDKYVNVNDNIILNIYEVLNTNGMKLLYENDNGIKNDLKLYSYLVKKSQITSVEDLTTQLKNNQTNYYNVGNNNSVSSEENIINTNNERNANKKTISNILTLKEYMVYFPKEKINKKTLESKEITSEFAIPIFHYYRSAKDSEHLFRDFCHNKINKFPVQYIILNNSYNISAKQLYEYIWYLNTLYMNHPNTSSNDFWWNNNDRLNNHSNNIKNKDNNIDYNNNNNNEINNNNSINDENENNMPNNNDNGSNNIIDNNKINNKIE